MGLINEEGKEIIKCKYKDISYLSEGFAVALTKDDRFIYVDEFDNELLYKTYCLDINDNGKKIIIVSDDKNVLYKEAIEYLTMLSNIDKTKNLKK